MSSAIGAWGCEDLTMTYKSWEALRPHLTISAGRVTADQIDLAMRLGITLAKATPSIVAAAKLRSAMSKELRLTSEGPPTEGQLEWLQELAERQGRRLPKPRTADEASAWIDYLQLRGRIQSHGELRLNAGDLVRVLHIGALEEVTSLGRDGRVYFRGARVGRRGLTDSR